MPRDIFKELLYSGDELVVRALTDRSCKNSVLNHVDSTSETNYELATLGDAVLRLCLLDLNLDMGEELSHIKEHYERDEVLVCIIGRHYHILEHLRFDENNPDRPTDYSWAPHGKGREDPVHKHIATCVEALLGAAYRMRGIRTAKAIVRHWVKLIDSYDAGSVRIL